MKKLLLFTLCCFLAQVSYGQIVEFNFNSSTLAPSAINASLTATNLIVSTGTISTGIITGTYFTDEPYIQSNAGWGEATSSTAKELCTTITIAAGYQLDITNIAYDAYATGAGPSATSFSIGAAGYLTSGTNLTSALLPINESITDQNNLSGTVTVCIQAWDNGSRTTSGGGDFRMDNFIITGLVTPLVVTPDRFEISSALPITAGVGNPFTVEVCATDGTSTDASYSTDIVLTDNASTATYTVSPSNTVTPTTGCATFTITPTSTGNINLDFGNADFTNQQASTVVYSIATPGNIVINEVSPDPGNGEGGNGEFIELFCNGTDACDIGCMVVATDDNNIFTIPSGTLVLPGEIFLIGKSSGLSCATCDFPGLTLDLDLDACADCGSSSSLSYDNGTSNTANGDGQRIVLFGEAGAIVNAMSYCSQAGADIQESNCIGTYDNDPDGCGPLFGSSNSGGVCDPISGGSPAGTQPEGFAYTYGDTAGGCSSFDIPNPGGLCSHSTSGVTLPAIGDAAYEYANFCIQGCSSSIARDTDGSTTWKEDNSPTPGLPNNSANGYINTSADNGVEPPTTTTDYNWDIDYHENDIPSDEISIQNCGTDVTITITNTIPNWVGVYPPGENTSESAVDNRMEAIVNTVQVSTGTTTSNDFTATWSMPTVAPDTATGETTIVQNLTISPAVATPSTAGVFDVILYTQENFDANGPECTYQYAVRVNVAACSNCNASGGIFPGQ